MNLLKAALYDPAAAVSKATSSLLAMTALDTTNLRLAITVPAHGMVRFRLRGAIVGAVTCPVILFGAMNGATVIGRVQPVCQPVTAPAATQVFVADAEFTVTGLAPGAMNVDAAYAVQVVVASTNIKYGGPNTNAGANAWGGFVFEAWDPQPLTANSTLAVDSSGRVTVGSNADKSGYSLTQNFPAQFANLSITAAGRVDVASVAGTSQTARDLGAQLDANVSSRAAASTAVSNVDYTAARAAKVDNLDAAVSSRLSSAGYTAPDNTGIGVAAAAAASAATSGTAIKAKTDQLNFAVAGKLDANVLVVNGIALQGAGTSASPWRPA